MSINATGAAKRELIPAGNYACRCISQVEIGTVTEAYMGKMKTQQKIMITWELPTEKKIFNPEKGEQPFVISQEFTLSMFEGSNLRKLLESWRGKGFTESEVKAFDVTKLLGVPGLVNIIHKPKLNGELKQAIATITPLPKGMKIPTQINPTFVLSYDEWNDEKFATLPDFLRNKMKESEEYKYLMSPQTKEFNQDYEDLTNGNLEIEDDGSLPF